MAAENGAAKEKAFEVKLTKFQHKAECKFCREIIWPGDIAIEYLVANRAIGVSHLHHKLCLVFHRYGFFCPSHEHGDKDCDCSEIFK